MAKWSKWLEEEDVNDREVKPFEKIKANKNKPIIDRSNHKKKESKRVQKPEKQ